ncbi:MAG: aminoacyl-tRNA hydrolase [Candidatus Paceibacterota bacterium]|jgi:PTH1 family peptidyl-tRNA hydrolase
MSYIIVGLGNPGEQYENTRHNVGRMALDAIRKEYGGDFEFDKKKNALISEVEIVSAVSKSPKSKKEKVILMAPETFMNNSGKAVATVVKTIKAAQKLIVIYDDFNLPLGRMKISFDRSSGGHNGLESVIKAVKTTAFIRIRIGTAPEDAKGLAKVPHGEDKIEKFILGQFKDEEIKVLSKVMKKVVEAVAVLVTESKEKAMSIFN